MGKMSSKNDAKIGLSKTNSEGVRGRPGTKHILGCLERSRESGLISHLPGRECQVLISVIACLRVFHFDPGSCLLDTALCSIILGYLDFPSYKFMYANAVKIIGAVILSCV